MPKDRKEITDLLDRKLSEGREFMRDYMYLTIFPGLAIMITVLSFNLMGDGLRDALDPKLMQ